MLRSTLDECEADLRRRLAANVKARRRELRISIREAARRGGLKLQSWEGIERGEVNAHVRTLERIGTALDIDPAALLSRRSRARRKGRPAAAPSEVCRTLSGGA